MPHAWKSVRNRAASAPACRARALAKTRMTPVTTFTEWSAAGTSVVPANRIAWTPAGSTHWHRAHGDTDMRIVFLPPSLARRIPDRPAVFLATGLAREVLLALTGPHNYGDAAPGYGNAARARLLRVLVDELREAQEQPLYLPQPRDKRLQAIARALSDRPDDKASMDDLGRAAGAKINPVHITSDFLAEVIPDARGNLIGDKVQSVVFDNSKIRRYVPGFFATIPFAEGIRKTVQWFEAHPEFSVVDEAWDHLMDRIIEEYEAALTTVKARIIST